jgi:hypothetical protein
LPSIVSEVEDSASVLTEMNYCLKQAEFVLADTSQSVEDRDVLSWAWIRLAKSWSKCIVMEEYEIGLVLDDPEPVSGAQERS